MIIYMSDRLSKFLKISLVLLSSFKEEFGLTCPLLNKIFVFMRLSISSVF